MSGALLDFLNIFWWLTSTQRLSQGSLLLFSEARKRLGETLAGSGHVSVPLSRGKHRRLFQFRYCFAGSCISLIISMLLPRSCWCPGRSIKQILNGKLHIANFENLQLKSSKTNSLTVILI